MPGRTLRHLDEATVGLRGEVRRWAPWAVPHLKRVRRAVLGPDPNVRVRNEHFVPSEGTDLEPYLEAGDRLAVHHLIRYHWAIAVLSDDPPATLVDVATGAGYGAAMLAAALPTTEVIGLDLDADAVAGAAREHRAPNLSFRTGDLMQFETVGLTDIDCVVTFDTIEHIPHRELMLMGLVEHLSPAGRVLLSTPVHQAGVWLDPPWEHHRIEYSPDTLLDLLHRYFGRVDRPDNGTLPHREVFDVLAGSGIRYVLGMNPLVCSQPIRVPHDARATP